MATEFSQDLEAELQECRVALQGQAQVMLDLLLQFESRLQARLEAAESRIAALRADRDSSLAPTAGRRPDADPRSAVLTDAGYRSGSAAS